MCSQKSDFKEKHSSQLKPWFLKRSYPEKFVDFDK